MIGVRVLAATSLLTLAACGSHKSVAPVVYGNDPNATARIYNNPSESQTLAQPRAAAATPVQQAGYAPPQAGEANVISVELEPVSAIYLSDEEREARATELASLNAMNPQSTGKASVVVAQKGDTVYALGRRYDVSPQSIIATNRMRAPYHLEVGQRVTLPAGAKVAQAPAPRMTAAAKPVSTKTANAKTVRVRKGDTLYAISRRTGVSVEQLAQANGLRAPYELQPGQELRTPGATAATRVAAAPAQKSATPKKDASKYAKQVSYTPNAANALFAWPVRGKVISEYGIGEPGRRNDGINIAAPAGTPVRAAADGEVVYRGSELDGFGNLLLLKHTDGFVTAYAHNDAMLVNKGDVVRRGQVIAKVGKSGAVTTPQLHFEIRQKLKSIDPIALLESD